MTNLVDELLSVPVLRGPLVPLEQPGKTRDMPVGLGMPAPAELPVVEVGTPYVEEVEGPESEIWLLVVMACSFRPVPGKVAVRWARFAAHFHPDSSGNQPYVHDLYPHRVEDEVKIARQLALTPELTFQTVGVGVGGFQRNIEYSRMEPVISAAGHRSPTASWDYSATPVHQVIGGKLMCGLITTSAGLNALDVSLSVSADLDHQGWRLPAWLGGPKPKGAADTGGRRLLLWPPDAVQQGGTVQE